MRARHSKWLFSFLLVLLVSHSAIAQKSGTEPAQFERILAPVTEYGNQYVPQQHSIGSKPITITRSKNQYHISIDVSEIRWKTFATAPRTTYPDLEGFSITSAFDKPILPKMALPIALPNGKLPRVRYTTDSLKIYAPHDLPAVFSDVPKGLTESKVTPSPYEFPTMSFPEQRISVMRMQEGGKNNLGVIHIYPIRWDAGNRRYELSRSIDITLTFGEAASRTSVPVSDESGGGSLVINPEMMTEQERPAAEALQLHSSGAAVPSDYTEAVRIRVPRDGVYRIYASALNDSIENRRTVDPVTLRLFHRGVEQPIYVKAASSQRFSGLDYLEFIGEVSRNTHTGQYWDPYNAAGIYWLVWGGDDGRRFAVKSVEPVDPNPYYLRTFRETVHIEEEQYFDRLGGVHTSQYSDQMDLWFHSPALSAGTLTEFSFILSSPDPGSLSDIDLTIGLQGLSTESARNHQAGFYLNNQYIGESPQFVGLTNVTVNPNTDYPTLDLEDGANSFSVDVQEVQDEFESLALDWFEISYDRLFEAAEDYLTFTPPQSIVLDRVYEYNLSNFLSENIRIYRNDGVQLRDYSLQTDDKGLHAVRFQTRHHNQALRYYAVSDAGVDSAELEYTSWQDRVNGDEMVDYLVITPEKYFDSAETWRTYRTSLGWNAKVVTVEDIYRANNYGFVSPKAIRKVIRYYNARLPAGETLHVLLIGDTSSRLRTSSDMIPMRFYQTVKYGAAVTDYYFANIDTTDLLPEVAVGRIPVQSNEDLEIIFDKIQEYEQNAPYAEWRNRSLFIAGYDKVFKTQTEELLRFRTGQSIFPERLYIDLTAEHSRFYGGSADLIHYLNAGMYHVNFMGHGGGAVWADRSLFLREDIQRLNNLGMYPFVTSMTCFTGAIESERGLGELMIREPEAGAIGWYGSSGVGWIWNDFLLMYDLPEYLQNGEYTLGEIVNLSRINYIARAPRFGYSYLIPTMLHQYNLIGDPAMGLAVPEQGENVTLESENIHAGQQLQLHSVADAQTIIQIYDANNIPLYQDGNRVVTWESDDSGYRYFVDIPDTFAAGQGHVAWYQFSDDGIQHTHGSLPFAVDAPIVQNMRTVPAQPRTNEPVRFLAEVRPTGPIDSLIVHTNYSPVSIPMQKTDELAWESNEPLDGISAGTQVQWWIDVYQSNGQKISSPTSQFQVGFLPNLQVRTAGIAHGDFPTMNIVVHASDIIQGNTQPKMQVQLLSESGDTLHRDLTDLDFTSTNDDTVNLSFFNPGEELNLSLWLDPEGTVQEQNESDNQFSKLLQSPIYAVTPELGLTFDGETHGVLNQDSIAVTVSAGQIGEPRTIALAFREFPFEAKKWQMHPMLTSGANPRGIAVDYGPETIPVEISAERATMDSATRWYYRDEQSHEPWLRNAGNVTQTMAKETGIYSLFRAWDSTPPSVTTSVGEQPYLPEMYVGRTPKIRFVVEDSVGVDFRKDAFKLLLDKQPVPPEQTSIAWAQAARSTIIEFQPNLTQGLHSITFAAKDIHANRTEMPEYSIVVANDNALLDYGNFPNPFQSETYFYYEITSRVSDFTLDIFTVDGRRIIRFSPADVLLDGDITAPGFHKIRWDGRDRNGEFVSNGVYFYRFTVKIGGKTHTSVGKIAKAR